MRLKRKLYAVSGFSPAVVRQTITKQSSAKIIPFTPSWKKVLKRTPKGQAVINKAVKIEQTRAIGAKALGIPKYIMDPKTGKTVINPQYKTRSILQEGRHSGSILSEARDRVLDANLGKGKASVHDRINLRDNRNYNYKNLGDHRDLQNAFAFDSYGHKPIRNLDLGYAHAFSQEKINLGSFKDNKALQNLGIVKKPGFFDKVKGVFKKQ